MKYFIANEYQLDDYATWRRTSKSEWSRLQSGIEDMPEDGKWLTREQVVVLANLYAGYIVDPNGHSGARKADEWTAAMDKIFGVKK